MAAQLAGPNHAYKSKQVGSEPDKQVNQHVMYMTDTLTLVSLLGKPPAKRKTE